MKFVVISNMKKYERIITIIMLTVISFSNVGTPIAEAAQLEVSSLPKTATNSASQTTPVAPPKFHKPDNGSVLGDSTSLFVIGSGLQTQNSASKRIPLRMQQLAKKVYQTDEDVTLAVTNPDNDPFTTSVHNAKGKEVDVPVSESNDGTTSTVKLIGSNEITPGKYTIAVTDSQGSVVTQDFSWGVLAMNFDKDVYQPGDTGNISFGVLDDQGNMVCNATLELRIQNREFGINDVLSTEAASSSAQITVNPQCQKHDFSLQPDYQASYTLAKPGTYTMQLTAHTQNGMHTITQTVPVTKETAFDIQRVSATRIYPPNTYPMTITIKAKKDFSGTVTETVPQDFTITPATQSAQFTSGVVPTSYTTMQTMYLNTQNPGIQLQQAIATQSAGLVMPFHGNYPITQGFGTQMTDPMLQAFYTHYGLSGHDGVDFGLPMNTPLYTVDDGTVLQSGPGDYGITIIIGHVWGESYYGHLSNTVVTLGQHVSKGQLIGYSGESGEATGPHLHFGMRPTIPDVNNGYYGKIDPLAYLPYNQNQQSTPSLGPILPLLNTLGASTSADSAPSPTVSQSPTPTVSPTTSPTPQASVSATPDVSQTPTVTPPATPTIQQTTTITESTTPPANTAISVLDKQILLNEQIANSAQTEKVKVISWQVSLKKGQTTSLGYEFKAPPQSPQFYLLGPLQFYQNGSNKVVFQEQRSWQIASDDVGVEWYSNTTGSTWNGYSWQYRKKLDVDHTKVSTTGIGSNQTTVDSINGGSIVSWSHTVSGSNPALLVGVAVGVGFSDVNISATATYNGTAMTLLKTVHPNNDTAGFLDVFGVLNPPTGAHTVQVTVTGGFGTVEAGSQSFDNVTSFATAVSNVGSGTTPSVITSGSTSGNIVAGFLGAGKTISSATAPSTSRFIANLNNTSGAGNSAGATSPSTGSNVTMAWSMGSSGEWGAIAVEVRGTSVAYDAVGPSSSGFTPSQTSLSWNHTVSGSNTALMVGVSVGSDSSTGHDTGMSAAATYNGVSMTLLSTVHTDNSNVGFLDVFGLVNPPTGTHTVAVTISGGNAQEITGGSESFDNVNQSNAFGTPATNFGNSATATTGSISSTSGNIVAGFVATGTDVNSATAPAIGQFFANDDTATGAGDSAGATTPSTGSSVSISWSVTLDFWGAAAIEVNAASAPTPTVTFMDSGGDATQDTTSEQGFWGATGGNGQTVDCTVSETGPCSLKFLDPTTNAGAYIAASAVLAPAGRRISAYVKFDSFPASTHDFFYLTGTGNTGGILEVVITSTGQIQLDQNGTTIASGSTLSTGTWYRVGISYVINSTTNYRATVYLNGVPNIVYSQTSGGITLVNGTAVADLYVGFSTPFGANDTVSAVEHMDDIYVDSGTDLADPGNIHVTAKRPFANGNVNQFPNHTGTGSGYGSGNAVYVNDSPVSTANSVNSGATNNLFENYSLESASQGQVDISSYYPIAEDAWVNAKASGACTVADNAAIINSGTTVTKTLTTSDAIYSSILNSSSYPAGTEAVGISSCQTGSTARTVTLEDAGMMIAYTATDPNYLPNFPVLVNLPSDTDLHNHAQSNGNDILFTDSTGETLLPYEIESYTSSTGSLQAWVNISSLSADTDTIIYIYFGNPSASSLANKTGTWNSNYVAVYHLGENAASTTIGDSTSDAYTGTAARNTSNTATTGQIDGAQSLNGTSDKIDIGDKANLDFGTGSFSYYMWVNTPNSNPGSNVMFWKGGANSTEQGYDLEVASGPLWKFHMSDGVGGNYTAASNTASNNTWASISYVVNRSSGNLIPYLNGTAGTNVAIPGGFGSVSSTHATSIGYDAGNSSFFSQEKVDELEISNVALSSGWITTEYNNQNSPSTFATLGSVETDIYAPLLSQILRHGQFFGTVGVESGVLQPFTW